MLTCRQIKFNNSVKVQFPRSLHDTHFEKFRKKFRFKETLTNAHNRCKIIKQLYKHKTNINSVFTKYFS